MNEYLKIIKKHSDDISAFPMFFAFNNEQFEKGMKKLGLEKTDTSKICSFNGGGYLRKTDSKRLMDMFTAHRKEMSDAIAADKTGEEFIRIMFEYELSNHEYSYTMDDEPTINALGLTYEKIEKSESLKNGLQLAKNNVMMVDY